MVTGASVFILIGMISMLYFLLLAIVGLLSYASAMTSSLMSSRPVSVFIAIPYASTSTLFMIRLIASSVTVFGII